MRKTINIWDQKKLNKRDTKIDFELETIQSLFSNKFPGGVERKFCWVHRVIYRKEEEWRKLYERIIKHECVNFDSFLVSSIIVTAKKKPIKWVFRRKCTLDEHNSKIFKVILLRLWVSLF